MEKFCAEVEFHGSMDSLLYQTVSQDIFEDYYTDAISVNKKFKVAQDEGRVIKEVVLCGTLCCWLCTFETKKVSGY